MGGRVRQACGPGSKQASAREGSGEGHRQGALGSLYNLYTDGL